MHWCMEETMALVTAIGFLPFVGAWLRAKLSRKSNCPCGHKNGEEH